MFYLIFFFGVGLIVGSFLNVVFIRTEREEEYISGRSHCDTCNRMLAWYENIPVVSYLFLRGKCRTCKALIPKQHLWFELGTGISFFLIAKVFFESAHLETWLMSFWLCVLVSLFILIVVSDVVSMEIPFVFLVGINVVTAVYLGVYFFLFEKATPFLETFLYQSLLGGLCAWAFFFVLVYFSKETWMGWGDVWIALAGGLAVGVKLVLLMLTISFASGALFGITLLFSHKKNLQAQVPFAPFLVFGIMAILSINQVYPEWLRFFVW